MPASLYKDSTLNGYSPRMVKLLRWLTGETQGDLGTSGPGTATVRIVEAWDQGSNGGNRTVSSDGTIDGLAATSRWRTGAPNIQNGWIVVEFDGTGVNGNTGFQWFFQYNGGTIGDTDDTNVVIPRKDWVTDDGNPGAVLSTQALIAAETTSGLCTNPIGASTGAPWTTQMIYYAWADSGMIMILADDTTSAGDIGLIYAGEVDDAFSTDAYPFVASTATSLDPGLTLAGSGSSFHWSRISPVDETTLLTEGRSMTFCLTTDSTPFNDSSTGTADFGGYYRSPVGVAFLTGGHAHVAGTLRYVNATHVDAGGRWTSDGLTRIGWGVRGSFVSPSPCGYSMDWDGTTPHP